MASRDSTVDSGSGSLLAPSRLAPRVSDSGAPAPFTLRPSALSAAPARGEASQPSSSSDPAASSGFKLQPPRFNNPLAPSTAALAECGAQKEEEEGRPDDDVPSLALSSSADGLKTASNGQTVTSTSATSTADDAPAASLSTGRTFVFGENIQERVINAAQPSASSGGDGEKESDSESEDAAAESASDATPADSPGVAPDRSKSLLERSAEQYERRQHSGKRSLDQVPVVTGEEDERNVLTVGCKLYAFEKSSCSYRERGRGQLRLNDRLPGGGKQQSRLVFRVQGSMRLALNAGLWAGMDLRQPSARDVTVTAMDGDQVRVFLLKCAPKDADQLYAALRHRLGALRESNGDASPVGEGGGCDSVEERAESGSEDAQSPVKRQRVD